VGGVGLPAGELVGDEVLDVPALELPRKDRRPVASQNTVKSRTASV
jgi:hypothetical protein